MNFLEIYKELIAGKSLARALLHIESKKYTIAGNVLDIGGGGKPSEYLDYFKRGGDYKRECIDFKINDKFNLEKDRLPYLDEYFDQILNFNLLEHIYNYNFVVSESSRVLKNNGVVLGFVPFLLYYHPDPHDYFRYTKEALFKIFTDAGFREINVKEIGGSAFFVNYNNLVFSLPLILRLIIFPFYYLFDYIFIKIRPNVLVRYPLGYYFVLKK